MVNRKGLGLGLGKGYKNMLPQDSFIHQLSAKGIKTKNVYKLPIQTAIIVPSTKKDDYVSTTEFRKRVKTTKDELSELFGGYTSISAEGEFTDEKGRKIPEPNNVVVAYTNQKDFDENKDEFVQYVIDKKKEWDQKSVAVVIENDMFFV